MSIASKMWMFFPGICASRTRKQAAARDADEKPAVDVDAMSADEREALLQKLLAKKEAD